MTDNSVLNSCNVVVLAEIGKGETFVIHAPRGLSADGYTHGIGQGWSQAIAKLNAIRIAASERAQFVNVIVMPRSFDAFGAAS